MGKLYKIGAEFERIAEACIWNEDLKAWVDYDTGEIITDEAYHDMLFALSAERARILEWCAKTYLDDNAKTEMIKAEIKRLQALQKFHERRAERMKNVIDREQAGEPADFGFCKVSYRASMPVLYEKADEQKIIAWCLSNGHDECVKTSYEIKKTELGKLIDDGAEVNAWATHEKRKNISIK